jgi:hypothetical protein
MNSAQTSTGIRSKLSASASWRAASAASRRQPACISNAIAGGPLIRAKTTPSCGSFRDSGSTQPIAGLVATRDLPDGHGGVIAAATVHRVALAELADRFATVVENVAVLTD